MKERGILFSAPLVHALLAGTKTQTRRLPKPPMTMTDRGGIAWRGCAYGMRTDGSPFLDELLKRCPYGVPGDRLWVRETWATLTGNGIRTVYRADGEDPRTGWDDTPAEQRPAMRWRPSIYMPRSASRITLEVTEVRIQRLQDITEEDARAEGVAPVPFCRAGTPPGNEHRESFAELWDAINGDRASWASNPWVWAVSFRRMP